MSTLNPFLFLGQAVHQYINSITSNIRKKMQPMGEIFWMCSLINNTIHLLPLPTWRLKYSIWHFASIFLKWVDSKRGESSNPEWLWIQYWYPRQLTPCWQSSKAENHVFSRLWTLSFYPTLLLSVYPPFIFSYKDYCEAIWQQTAISQVASTITLKHDFRGLAGIENPFMTHCDEYGHFITHFTCGRWFIKTPGEVSSVNHLQSLQPMKEHLEAIRFPSFPVMFLWQGVHQRHVF